MNTPIISPWLIYLCGIVNSLRTVAIIGALLTGGFFILFIPLYSLSKEDGDVESATRMVPWFKRMLVLGLIFLFSTLLIPSKNTLITMIVARKTTCARISKVIKEGGSIHEALKKDLVDIITAIESGNSSKGDDR